DRTSTKRWDSEENGSDFSSVIMVISCRINVTNLKHPVKESISLKRVMGQHLFKPSYGCHVRSSLKAASQCANITF
ncbi:hypothetical protein, partial [Pantoea agglomerans]